MADGLAVAAGRRFWALFDSSEGVWHERLVLRRTAGGHVVLTPDGDVHEELLEDYEDALPSGVAGGIPNRFSGHKALRYAFGPGDIADASAFRRRAEAYLAGWATAPPAADGRGAGARAYRRHRRRACPRGRRAGACC